MKQCIELAQDLGVRVIQLAGYDVYYEEKSPETRARFLKNLRQACDWAEQTQVMLAIEIMDDPLSTALRNIWLSRKKSIRLISLSIRIQAMSLPGTMTFTVSFCWGIKLLQPCI